MYTKDKICLLNKTTLFIFILLVSTITLSCIGYSTRYYKPITEKEKYAFGKANREIYPNDVRSNFNDYDSARVAWPGIIKNITFNSRPDTMVCDFLVEHHYYSWLEDFGAQHERIFLSPRGEGLIQFDMLLKAGADSLDVKKTIGSMIIVYGIPAGAEDSVVNLYSFDIRIIGQEWFTTTVMDYGREGEPIKVLRIPK